jgi:hypothetical protein
VFRVITRCSPDIFRTSRSFPARGSWRRRCEPCKRKVSIKFHRPVRPGATLELDLSETGGQAVQLTIREAGALAASVRFV